MLLLAIDTSGKQGSIALAQAEEENPTQSEVEIIEVAPLAGGTFSAQLIPQVAQLLSRFEFTIHGIGVFAVASGPGSFTGLRVGLAAVKALAEVLGKPIVPVSLLECCAFVSGVQGKVMAALDAGRNEVYVAEYGTTPLRSGNPQERVMPKSDFIAHAKQSTVVTPDSGLADAATAAGITVSRLDPLSAASVARLGWRKLQLGEIVTPEQLEANYIRRTDAEMLERTGS
jgi:tRNA threonylcarbamoyladenosine biosynthesis protein TsaB